MGATPWTDASGIADEFDELGRSYGTPEELIAELADFLTGLVDVRSTEVVMSRTDAGAVGTVQLSDVPDDSVAGLEYRVTMTQVGDGWAIQVLESRVHCRRDVSGDSCL